MVWNTATKMCIKLQQGVQQLVMQISRLRTENEKYVAKYYELVNEK
jgi:hypothetical protein